MRIKYQIFALLVLTIISACSAQPSKNSFTDIITCKNANSLSPVSHTEHKYIGDIAWVSEGSSIAISNDQDISIIDTLTLEEKQHMVIDSDLFQSPAISSKGDQAAIIADEFRKVEIWDTRSKELKMTIGYGDEYLFNAGFVSFNPDGSSIVTSTWLQEGPSLLFWDLTTGELIKKEVLQDVEVGWDRPIYNLIFSPDGKKLAAFTCDGSVYVFSEGWSIRLPYEGKYSTGSALSFSPDGNLLAIGSGGPKSYLKIFDLSTSWPDLVFDLQNSSGVVTDLSINADGSLIAGIVNGKVVLYDIKAGKELHKIDFSMPSDIAFSPDGTLLAITGYSAGLQLWGITEP